MYRFGAARVRHPEEAPLLLQRRSEGSALQQQPGLQQPRTQPRPLGGGRLGHPGVAAGISRSRGGRYLHYIQYVCMYCRGKWEIDFMCVSMCVSVWKINLMYVCEYVCLCLCMDVCGKCMHVCIYVGYEPNVCMYVCMYVCRPGPSWRRRAAEWTRSCWSLSP